MNHTFTYSKQNVAKLSSNFINFGHNSLFQVQAVPKANKGCSLHSKEVANPDSRGHLTLALLESDNPRKNSEKQKDTAQHHRKEQ